MSSETIPEWAMEDARAIWKGMGFVNDRLNQVPVLALALVAGDARAEQRGLEKAADHLLQMAKDTPLGHENVQRGRSTYNWLRYCEAAIRSLGEKA